MHGEDLITPNANEVILQHRRLSDSVQNTKFIALWRVTILGAVQLLIFSTDMLAGYNGDFGKIILRNLKTNTNKHQDNVHEISLKPDM